MWLEHFKMVMNEYRLAGGSEQANQVLFDQAEKFFFGEGAQLPPDYKPPAAKGRGVRGQGEILVVSGYELGRRPVWAACAIGALERAGFAPAAQDVSVDRLSPQALSGARLVLISVPMHTALQLGVRVAERAREAGARVAFFGLYAALNAAHLRDRHGDFVAVPREPVLADVAQQIAAGARHVSFGDPDFLNGPTHALRIARELHERWPRVSFDATIKIEHLLEHRALLPELVHCGMIFVTSAVESLNDRVLEALRKGHAAADVPLALAAVREAGAELRPTLLPFTPWAALEDLPALFDFAVGHDLVSAIDPVQYTLRLLLPPGSLLLEDAGPWLRDFDSDAFTWRWQHEDPRVDALWRDSVEAVRGDAGFDELRALADRTLRRPPARRVSRSQRSVPRLTEPWFC